MGCGLGKHTINVDEPEVLRKEDVQLQTEVTTYYTCFGLVPWSVTAKRSANITHIYDQEEALKATALKHTRWRIGQPTLTSITNT